MPGLPRCVPRRRLWLKLEALHITRRRTLRVPWPALVRGASVRRSRAEARRDRARVLLSVRTPQVAEHARVLRRRDHGSMRSGCSRLWHGARRSGVAIADLCYVEDGADPAADDLPARLQRVVCVGRIT